MRYIKFRGYLKDNYLERIKEFWWYKDECNNRMRKIHSLHLNTKKVIVSNLTGGNQSVLFDEIEIMQYTGLKDKNGVEIYEGDVIKASWYNKNLTVVFTDGSYYLKDEYNRHFPYSEIIERIKGNIQGNIKVIGNIYDNPELLEVKDV